MAIRSHVSLRDARKAFITMRRGYLVAIRRVLRERVQRCDDKCNGWFIDLETNRPQRCDDCAKIGHYANLITDDEIASLPEVKKALLVLGIQSLPDGPPDDSWHDEVLKKSES